MHAERRIHILEKAFANEAAFGTAVLAAFFAGRSVNADFTARQFCSLCERSAGERTGGAEKVVTAPVPETDERIVLGQKAENRTGFAGFESCIKTRRMTGHINLDFKTFTFQQLRKPLAGKVFMVAGFRMRVNIARGSLIDWEALLDKRFDDLFGGFGSHDGRLSFFEGMDADAFFWEPCSAFRYASKNTADE